MIRARAAAAAALASLCRRQRPTTVRCFATTTTDITDGVATLFLARKPVNSLSLEVLSEVTEQLVELEANDKVSAVVLASSLPRIYSAGLDIEELYQPDPERLFKFWTTLQDMFITLYGLEKPVVAAINGNSPAGGCMLATSCDYRIMAKGKFVIGLNETQLGIAAPQWLVDAFVALIGQRHADRMLQLGALVSPEEALDIGLVDRLVEEEADVLGVAQEEAARVWARIPAAARHQSKWRARRRLLEEMAEYRHQEAKDFVEFCTQAEVQSTLGGYIEQLKQRRSSSK